MSCHGKTVGYRAHEKRSGGWSVWACVQDHGQGWRMRGGSCAGGEEKGRLSEMVLAIDCI